MIYVEHGYEPPIVSGDCDWDYALGQSKPNYPMPAIPLEAVYIHDYDGMFTGIHGFVEGIDLVSLSLSDQWPIVAVWNRTHDKFCGCTQCDDYTDY